jgi:NADH-quinone oxidoreductase subunit K
MSLHVGLPHVLVVAALLFCCGLICAVTRRNAVGLLMGVELILNAANINFVAFARQLGDLTGQVFAVFVITIAAAEAAIGLGIIIALVRLKQTVQLDHVNEMQG